ncbi:MAG: SHOCT domain-containing protein [Rhodospirillales bacterium]|nr:SHOCT domain-containing protein [Rhodospirillales bacterium]
MKKMLQWISATVLMPVAVLLIPISAWANGEGTAGGYHGGYGMGGWGHGLFGPLLMILVIGGIVATVVLLTRKRCTHRHGGHGPRGKSPQDILKERYARGEMTTKEFEERRKILGD